MTGGGRGNVLLMQKNKNKNKKLQLKKYVDVLCFALISNDRSHFSMRVFFDRIV